MRAIGNCRGWTIVAILPVFVILAGMGSAMAADPETDWKVGKLGHLSRYIGTVQYEPIFEDPFVRQAMKDLLGDELPHLLRNMDVRGPINFLGPLLVISGGRAHETNLENGLLLVNVYDGTIHAAIYSQGQATIYSRVDAETERYFSETKIYQMLPQALREFANWDEFVKVIDQKPTKNFRWVK